MHIKQNSLRVVVLFALMMTFLFHDQFMGVNLLVFELVLLLILYFNGTLKALSAVSVRLLTAVGISALLTFVVHSTYSFVVHYLFLLLFTGSLAIEGLRSAALAFPAGLFHFIQAQWQFVKNFIQGLQTGGRFAYWLSRSLMVVLPLLLVLVFVAMYRSANPVFNEWFGLADDFITNFFDWIFLHFDEELIPSFILSMLLANFFLLRSGNQWLSRLQEQGKDQLQRIRNKEKRSFRMPALKMEYRMAVLALLLLNLLLLIMNSSDVYFVWFNFEWEGQYLKQFVHEGTYVLLLSILLSIAVVLYFFRGNLNFLSSNGWLRKLSYIWLAQNALLAVSVAIRNYWYIHYFALAYKRIGVILFLGLCLYGLWTVYVKVSQRKTAYYLIRKNVSAILLVLLLSSAIPWDIVIARYNFRHAASAFLHLDFMARLSDNALPLLDVDAADLHRIEKIQKEKFPYETQYMEADEYLEVIEKRKAAFISSYRQRRASEWNVADYWTYKIVNSE